MKLKPLRERLRKTCSESVALGDVLDVGDVRVGHVLAEVDQALVVGLAPAAVVVRSDEDHGDVELAFDDLRDLGQAGGGTGLAGGGTRRRAWAATARGAGADDERTCREQRQRLHEAAGHRVLSSKRSPCVAAPRAIGREVAAHRPAMGPGPGRITPPKNSPRTAPPKGRWTRIGGRDGPPRAGRRAVGVRDGGVSATLPPDVRTHGAARRAARHLRAAARVPVGHDRGARPGGLAPRGRRPGRLRPLHGAPHLQGDAGLPDDAGALRGRGGDRRHLQRLDRPRDDGLLRPRAGPPRCHWP